MSCLLFLVFPMMWELGKRIKPLSPTIMIIAVRTHLTFLAKKLLANEKDLDLIARSKRREWIKESFKFTRKVKANMADFFMAKPASGTKLYECTNSEDLLPEDSHCENLTSTRYFNPRELEWMARRRCVKYNWVSFSPIPGIYSKKPLCTFGCGNQIHCLIFCFGSIAGISDEAGVN